LLQMSSSAHQRRSIVTYDADEYAGDSDWFTHSYAVFIVNIPIYKQQS
jgi:hypothetical protein